MELKRLITHFTYRIEPKPEGGFIAHATDPTVPPLEAPTREELQRKIQANIAAGLTSEFPGLKLPLENQELKFAFHIELMPGGGFAIYSADPNAKPIEGATHETGRPIRPGNPSLAFRQEAHWRRSVRPTRPPGARAACSR